MDEEFKDDYLSSNGEESQASCAEMAEPACGNEDSLMQSDEDKMEIIKESPNFEAKVTVKDEDLNENEILNKSTSSSSGDASESLQLVPESAVETNVTPASDSVEEENKSNDREVDAPMVEDEESNNQLALESSSVENTNDGLDEEPMDYEVDEETSVKGSAAGNSDDADNGKTDAQCDKKESALRPAEVEAKEASEKDDADETSMRSRSMANQNGEDAQLSNHTEKSNGSSEVAMDDEDKLGDAEETSKGETVALSDDVDNLVDIKTAKEEKTLPQENGLDSRENGISGDDKDSGLPSPTRDEGEPADVHEEEIAQAVLNTIVTHVAQSMLHV